MQFIFSLNTASLIFVYMNKCFFYFCFLFLIIQIQGRFYFFIFLFLRYDNFVDFYLSLEKKKSLKTFY